MPERRFSANNQYRYGFNGKENDNEVRGEGRQQDYGMRIYDSRLGKFLSVDPLDREYPWYSPYQFAGNKPIKFVDLDGLEEAAPEEFQRASAYLESAIKPYISQYAQLRAFKYISPEKITSQLQEAIKNPGTLGKKATGVGGICAVYAFSYIYSIYYPENFVKGVASLYITGKAEIGGLLVEPQGTLRDASNEKANHDAQSLPTFVFGGSMRSHYNQFTNYSRMSKIWGATGSATMKAWLEDRMSLAVTEFDYGKETVGNGVTSDDLVTLQSHLNSGKQAMVRVNGKKYNGHTSKKYGALGGDVYSGDHWIVLNGQMTIDNEKETITITGFDMNEGLQTKTFSKAFFMGMVNHVMMVQRKTSNEKNP